MLNGEGLGGGQAGLSNVNASHHAVFIKTTDAASSVRQWLHGGPYQLVIANAGNAKSGTLEIYVMSGVL